MDPQPLVNEKRNKQSFLYIFSNGFEIFEITDILFAHEIWEIQAKLVFPSIEQSVHKAVLSYLMLKLLCTAS